MTKPRPTQELLAVEAHAGRVAQATAVRDKAIREAYRAGASTRAIAEAAWLSQSRVAQIVRGNR